MLYLISSCFIFAQSSNVMRPDKGAVCSFTCMSTCHGPAKWFVHWPTKDWADKQNVFVQKLWHAIFSKYVKQPYKNNNLKINYNSDYIKSSHIAVLFCFHTSNVTLCVTLSCYLENQGQLLCYFTMRVYGECMYKRVRQTGGGVYDPIPRAKLLLLGGR